MLEQINAILWGPGTLLLFFGSGIYMTVLFKGVQVRHFLLSFRCVLSGLKPEKNAAKNTPSAGIPPWLALLTSLAAVMGPGNIVGVGSALLLGGPGALVWMWLSAAFGMALRYGESRLAVIHRRQKGNENYGGPMYVMRDRGWRAAAAVFALMGGLTALFMSDAVPSSALAQSLFADYNIHTALTGGTLALLTAAAVSGGGRRIAAVSAILVPVVSGGFLILSVAAVITFRQYLPGALTLIFSEAFSLKAGLGGLLGGAVRFGAARGIYSHEAGMGTEPLISAATSEENPHRQGLISMTGVFIDTMVFCAVTGLVVVMAGMDGGTGDNPATAVSRAFERILPGLGGAAVSVTLALLVAATVVSWEFYGEQCVRYFTANKAVIWGYRAVYAAIPAVAAGAALGKMLVLSDIFIAAMALPNLAVTVIARGGKDYSHPSEPQIKTTLSGN